MGINKEFINRALEEEGKNKPIADITFLNKRKFTGNIATLKDKTAISLAKNSLYGILIFTAIIVLTGLFYYFKIGKTENTIFIQDIIKCVLSLYTTIVGFIIGYFYNKQNNS